MKWCTLLERWKNILAVNSQGQKTAQQTASGKIWRLVMTYQAWGSCLYLSRGVPFKVQFSCKKFFSKVKTRYRMVVFITGKQLKVYLSWLNFHSFIIGSSREQDYDVLSLCDNGPINSVLWFQLCVLTESFTIAKK